MFFLRKEGFVIYVISQILLLVNIWLNMSIPFNVAIVNTLPEITITIGFILLYAVHVDRMKWEKSFKMLFKF